MHVFPSAVISEDLANLGTTAPVPSRRFLAVIVFANARLEFSQRNILPLIAYWHFRSGDHIEFFFPGYALPANASLSAEELLAAFSEQKFVEALNKFQNESTWQYSGETGVLICTATVKEIYTIGQGTQNKLSPDLDNVIEFDLERAIEDKVIASAPIFFESVIRFARENPLTHKLSDHLGLVTVGTIVVDSICEYIESVSVGGIRRAINAIRFFRVRGLRRKAHNQDAAPDGRGRR